jgi:hypothetical protein
MWTRGQARAGATTAILAVLIYFALVLPMLSGFAGARHLGGVGAAAAVEVLCAEHNPVSGGSDNQQHDPAQHDTCCLLGFQFAGWVGFRQRQPLSFASLTPRFPTDLLPATWLRD